MSRYSKDNCNTTLSRLINKDYETVLKLSINTTNDIKINTKKPYKKLDTNYIKTTTDQISNRTNDDKKLSFKKSEFIINLFLKNKVKKKEKKQTKKIEINNYRVQNTFNKNKNDYMFKTINTFYKKKEIRNNKIIDKQKEKKEECKKLYKMKKKKKN